MRVRLAFVAITAGTLALVGCQSTDKPAPAPLPACQEEDGSGDRDFHGCVWDDGSGVRVEYPDCASADWSVPATVDRCTVETRSV